ncbi:MAG: hypothetical protein RSC84_02500 [Peptostreptococcaceae bacterium]
MNRKYNLRLDLQFRCNNSTIKFRQSDNNTSDFFMRVTIGGKLLDIDKAIVVLATIKPNMTSQAQFLEVKDGKIYADLNANMKDQVGTYKAQALLILENERVATDIIEYEVTEDNILNKLESTVQSTEEFTMLRDMLNRLSIIETSEMSRVENEENREKAEKLRKDVIEKIKLDVNKLIEDTNLKLANSLKSNTDKVDTLVRDANKKIDDNLETNTNTVNKLVTDTEEKINSYKNEKDKELNDNLTKYKNDTTKNIYDEFDTYELDTNEVIKENLTNHKNQSNLDIRKILTDNINVKNREFDDNIKIKNIQVDNKLKEVDVAEKNREAAETKRAEDHIKREEFLNSFESQLETIESKNTNQDNKISDIEYVNIEQDNKIGRVVNRQDRQQTQLDILYRTTLDGRHEITEEGSVVSLPYSKDGVVEIVGLEGNTLVNYCTDGAKEMTLNGDIDVEGTFITTTEGVDNGQVDVLCEGNTLVNLSKNPYVMNGHVDNPITTNDTITITLEDAYKYRNANLNQKLIKGKTYTIIGRILENNININTVGFAPIDQKGSDENGEAAYLKPNQVGIFELIITPTIEDSDVLRFLKSNTSEGTDINRKIVIENKILVLEGNFVGIGLQHFEGIKSVGQDDENGHKIEILSNNKNLFDINSIIENNFLQGNAGTNNYGSCAYSSVTNISDYIKVKNGFTYILGYEYIELLNTTSRGYCFYDNNKNVIIPSKDTTYSVKNKETQFTPQQDGYIRFAYDKNCQNIQFEISSIATPDAPYSLNKKEILLNEPLRGLPNGVKDIFVKISGKWFIERNCGEYVFNGLDGTYTLRTDLVTDYLIFNTPQIMHNENSNNIKGIICDTFIQKFNVEPNMEFIRFATDRYTSISINPNKLETQDVEGFKKWLQANPTKVVYQLATPTYEPITDPTLTTYLDTTHISNNSIIPCNMKVKNTGYNAIIKPSTLYTVALGASEVKKDIGMNLGGIKGTTNSGVLTLTTPATLVDDSLRISGKGMKGSQVRLLEGDNTKWVPGHFEGMKSCFEDKVQEDGFYKMEFISNNENLFNYQNFRSAIVKNITNKSFTMSSWADSLLTDKYIRTILKPNTTYNIKGKFTLTKASDLDVYSLSVGFIIYDRGNTWINLYAPVLAQVGQSSMLNRTFTTPSNLGNYEILTYTNRYVGDGKVELGEVMVEDLILSETNPLTYVSHQYNKIQLPSIEPLRSVGNIKDKFIFKNGNLMIERNCKYMRINGTEDWMRWQNSTERQIYSCRIELKDAPNNRSFRVKCNMFSDSGNNSDAHCYYSEKFESIDGYYANIHTNKVLGLGLLQSRIGGNTIQHFNDYIKNNNFDVVYELAEPTYEEIPFEEIPFELKKIILGGYKNGTLFIDTNIPPTTNVSYSCSMPSVFDMNSNIEGLQEHNVDMVATSWDMDYRLLEMEWALEDITGVVFNLNNIKIGGTNMAISRFEQAKIMIIGGAYNKATLTKQLSRYLEKKILTQTEYDELIALMEAKELVVGE